ncbi:hypothetical protein A0J51_00981 [Gluconobacter japonicus]|nr:hypothetical protein A0J51_00981 [Gluconobacter japonicus]
MPEILGAPGDYVLRPEFERHLDKFDGVAKQVHEHGILLAQQAASSRDQANSLKAIQTKLDEQDRVRGERDRAMKNTIWAANTLGPKALGIAGLCLGAFYAWLKGHLG